MALVVGPLGLALFGRKRGWRFSVGHHLRTYAALFHMGTGAMTVLQMGIAPAPVGHRAGGIVTSLFAVVPLALGVLTLRLAVAGAPGKGARVKLALAGALGLLFWGGLIVGPVLAFLAAALPARAFADSPPHSK